MEDNLHNELKSCCSKNCLKNGDCINMLQLFLDGVACRTEYKHFLDGICDCKPCCDYFHVHDAIKDCVKTKSEEKCVPDELQLNVKNIMKNIAKEYKRGY